MPQPLARTLGAVLGTGVGVALVMAGLVMLITPGPGLVTIAAGTAVLSRHHTAVARLRSRVAARLRRGPEGPRPA